MVSFVNVLASVWRCFEKFAFVFDKMECGLSNTTNRRAPVSAQGKDCLGLGVLGACGKKRAAS